MPPLSLLKTARNPDLVPGVYNYCDRWCERCRFTTRCLVFLSQEPEERAEVAAGESGEKVLQFVHLRLQETVALLQHMASEHGIHLSAVGPGEGPAGRPATEARSDAIADAIVTAARGYGSLVTDWFHTERDLFRAEKWGRSAAASAPAALEAEIRRAREAVDVIRWFQYFISVKIRRALSVPPVEIGGGRNDPESDANGSAKVALIGIDRSIAAWADLRRSRPEAVTIDILVDELERLRLAVEEYFPLARAFIRPGFDTEPGTN